MPTGTQVPPGAGRGTRKGVDDQAVLVQEPQHPLDHRSFRWAVSLKLRTNQRSAVTMSLEIDALSAALKANGLEPLASASAWPITPPCVNTATRWLGCAAARRPIAALTRPSKETSDSAPGITSQRSSANIRCAIG